MINFVRTMTKRGAQTSDLQLPSQVTFFKETQLFNIRKSMSIYF